MTRHGWMAPLIVALLALAATVTSIGHDFTFDDRYVILSNLQVHDLKHLGRLFGQTYWPKELGGDGYRPVVMSLFTLQWVAGGGAPWVFHLVNILLAVGAALAVQWCAAAVLPTAASWVAGALFAVHPVHVEVTGNIVGQSELVVAICLSIAVGIYLRGRRGGALPARDATAILGLYAVGLFAKEHAVVLPALLVAAECTVVGDPDRRSRVREARMFALLFIAVTLTYLYVRGLVLKDLAGFVPFPMFRFLHMSAFDRIATMMTEIPRIARLLVFPTHLSGDYSPTEVIVAHGPDAIQLPGVFICVGAMLLAIVLRKRAPVASFGLLWLMIAFLPVSNFFIPAGFITAERTLFFPSVGVVLIVGALVAHVSARERRAVQLAMAAGIVGLLAMGVTRSISRQRVWKNNDVFFDQLVRDEPNGYRAHFLRGRHIGSHYRLRETEREYKRAIQLFPYDVSMTLAIAADYYRAGLCAPATTLLDWSFSIEPTVRDGRYEYADCLARQGRWRESREQALAGMRLIPGRQLVPMRALLARADSALGRSPPHVAATRKTPLPQSATDAAISRTDDARSALVEKP